MGAVKLKPMILKDAETNEDEGQMSAEPPPPRLTNRQLTLAQAWPEDDEEDEPKED